MAGVGEFHNLPHSKLVYNSVGFDVFTAMIMNNCGFWDITDYTAFYSRRHNSSLFKINFIYVRNDNIQSNSKLLSGFKFIVHGNPDSNLESFSLKLNFVLTTILK
jgi:hypothetical protein